MSVQESVLVYTAVENFENLKRETLKQNNHWKGGSDLHTINESTIM